MEGCLPSASYNCPPSPTFSVTFIAIIIYIKPIFKQIAFFQHERLVTSDRYHDLCSSDNAFVWHRPAYTAIQLTVLTAALLVLLIPYIFHYYLLENEVQKMYAQYDEIWENCNIILQEKCLGKSSKK